MIDHISDITPAATFDPPAPGGWELETAHHGLRPLSPILRDTYRRAFDTGIVEVMPRYGLPLATVQTELVHGCLYMRPLAVGEKPGSKPKAPPPAFVMKLVCRLHPELRRRAKTAEQVFAERRWRQEVDQWFDEERSAQLSRNRALQGVKLAGLDDADLAAHIARTLSHFEQSARRNLATHGGDLVPTGDLVAHCEEWGISANEAAGLLTGSSPATVETATMLRPVARAIKDSGRAASLNSVDDARALGPDVKAAVDAWLELHMWRTVTSDDVDRPTLAEAPALQLAALLAATEHLDVTQPDEEAVRARVPAARRAQFDELLVEARYGHRQRDDIRGLCWNWPCGLVRRGLLEAGRRLHERGAVHEVAHIAELFPDELDRLLRGVAATPSADVLAERAAERDRIEATPPPRSLGEPESPPPLDALPRAMARVTAAVMAILDADVTPPPAHDDELSVSGIGIGGTAYVGRACVVRDLMLAFDQLEPGDVLVAPFTGPSINSLLPVVGALVVEEGGALCHAAIVAREFGVAGVIGAHAATSRIPHGAHVEVDPEHGTVRVL